MARIKTNKNISKRELILKKAAVLFREKGFAGSTMRELADMVGVEAPSLYNHIGSKTELLQAICFQVADLFNRHLEEVKQSPSGYVKKLEEIIRFHIQMMQASFDEVYVANHEWKQLPAPLFAEYLDQRRNYEAILTGWMEEGIRKKEFKKLNTRLTILTILSALRGLESLFKNKKHISSNELENNLITQLLYGINK
jgi:AcrR family transcriptional regulator